MNKFGIALCVFVSFFATACSSVVDLRQQADEDDTGGTITTTSSTTISTTSTTTTSTDTASGGGGSGGEGAAGGNGGASPVATFSLAMNPASGIFVKKSANVPVVGIVITAGDEDITIPSITLTSQAEIAGSGCSLGEYCAREAAYTRMTSLAIWDGSTQVGYAMSPEPSSGRATITGIDAMIPAGTSKTFVVKAHFSSQASDDPYDHVAVGVENVWEIVVIDAQQQSVLGTLESDLQGQTGASPTVLHEIRKSGTFSVVDNDHPSMTNIVAGKDAWVPFALYKACAEYEAVSFDVAHIIQSSASADNSDFVQIAVASGGAVHGTGILPAGSTGAVNVFLSNGVITAPKDECVNFQLWGKMANVLPTSAVNGQFGYPRSGHMPQLGIAESVTTDEWTPEYAGNLNLRSTGVTSGERAYAAAGASAGNPMVLRKSVPTIAKQPLSSTTLANTDLDLIKFQVAADAAGPVALKQWNLTFSKTGLFGLTNFRLRKGASDMPITDYRVQIVTGPSQTGTTVDPTTDFGYIRVVLLDEQTVTGSGNVYTIHASVSGATSGSAITLQFASIPNTSTVTGCLAYESADPNNPYFLLQHDGEQLDYGFFLWSDLSEIPHSATDCSQGGSVDWVNHAFLQDLIGSQTLSL